MIFGGDMGYKKNEPNISFAELSLMSSMKHNRTLKLLEEIGNVIEWPKVEVLLMEHYTVGTSKEGADAYPPMMLLRALLLQKWFKVNSDPELENQINDRISFKKFLCLSLDKPSPDHSTFCRFRDRLSKNAMMELNSAILQQLADKGLSITEGVAIDARLVRSISHPISKEEIGKLKEKKATPEGKLDKTGKSLKYSRDHESDWTVKNNKPHYGLKEHAAVDTTNGFVLATELTPASVNDSIYLPYCVAASCHTEEQIKKVYADKGYYGEPNSQFLHMNRIEDGIMGKDTKSTKLTDYGKERNKKISKLRYIVEQYFGISHLHSDAFQARFPRLNKNTIDAMFRQMAFNLFRGTKILRAV